MGGDHVLACFITAFCPSQDTEKTSWSSVGLNLEGSEGREARLSLETALFHDHREAGFPEESPRSRQSQKADITALLRPNQEPDVGEINSESRCAIEAPQ